MSTINTSDEAVERARAQEALEEVAGIMDERASLHIIEGWRCDDAIVKEAKEAAAAIRAAIAKEEG